MGSGVDRGGARNPMEEEDLRAALLWEVCASNNPRTLRATVRRGGGGLARLLLFSPAVMAVVVVVVVVVISLHSFWGCADPTIG